MIKKLFIELSHEKPTNRGQTVIETIAMLLILLLIFFVIAEFARAWYLKNSLNNSARVGARAAIVTPNLTAMSNTCSAAGLDNPIEKACSASGIPSTATVAIDIEDTNGNGSINQGEKVTVTVTAIFNSVVPNLLPFMPGTLSSAASMRYEL